MENNKKEEFNNSEKELQERWENLKIDFNNAKGGTSILGLLGIAFIVLKLCTVIDWSWWWVLSPFWAPLAIALIFAVVILIGTLIVVCFIKDKDLEEVQEIDDNNSTKMEEVKEVPISTNLESTTTSNKEVAYNTSEDKDEVICIVKPSSNVGFVDKEDTPTQDGTENASTLTSTPEEKKEEIKVTKVKSKRRKRAKKDGEGNNKKSSDKDEPSTTQSK